MAIYELKAEIALPSVGPWEDFLAEHEEQRLMVLEDKPSAKAWLTGYFATPEAALLAWSQLVPAGPTGGSVEQPKLRELPDTDWKDSYKVHFKAWKFGRLNWVPVWERDTFELQRGEEVLWLDPGMAFGTGNHETTRLVVERLVGFAAQHNVQGRVIDAGAGSGILALSAAKLGFIAISGFDNDSEAVRISDENAALNGLTGRVNFFVGDLVTGLAGRQGEIVMANIQADVLMRFAPQLCGAVAPGGLLVLSGILGTELLQVRAMFAALTPGWQIESRVLGEWADLALTRTS
jgi:ribosomal protein L11 methyltransferase